MSDEGTLVRATGLAALVASMLLVNAPPAAADDQPTVVKDSVQVTAYTYNVFHKDYDKWSWVPKIQFAVSGPLESGAQLYATFSMGGSPWVKFDCSTGVTPKGSSWKTECGGHDVPEDKASQATGMTDFVIHVRNELAATDKALFSGKAKVAKVHSNEHGPKAATKFVYYVDQDWNMPIGYLYLVPAQGSDGWDLPTFDAAFWVRGDWAGLDPHLFFKSKEIGRSFFQGDEVGKPGCEPDIELETSQGVEDSMPQKAKWSRIVCSFPNVVGWDKTKGPHGGPFAPPHVLATNAGDYELKILWKNHLARSIKFTVGPDGKFDNGVAAANKMGGARATVPVQILGDQDGAWDRTAWRTAAFYGNPLAGFTAVP